jgi:peptidoglycan/xylan/chitin deacetylase (PgdA/CDA1 family)
MTKRLIKLLISILVYSFDCLNEMIKLIAGLKRSSTCMILYYHVIKPEQRKRFSKQMDELLKAATPTFADRLTLHGDGHKYAAVTFDDGYSSVLENALPELKKRNIPATLFIPTGCLGTHPPWIDKKTEEYREVVMTAEQLSSLDTKLTSIGSHCMTHQSLLELSYEEAKKEIFQSKKNLEDILNRTIESISFPHGAYNHLHVELAQQSGYKHAFSIIPEMIYLNSIPFIMGRVRVDPNDWHLESKLKFAGAYRWLVRVSVLRKKFIQNS